MATRFPSDLRAFRKQYGYNSGNVFTTTNPKTLKNGTVSDRPTLVLHLEPVSFGVCPAAGSCAAVCLHKAGNPAYLDVKTARRRTRSESFVNDPARFLQLLVVEAARYRSKGYIGLRLNGTSDIAWERHTVDVTPDVLAWVRAYAPDSSIRLPGTYSLLPVLTSMGFEPYDYTKRIDRDWGLAAAYGYHLTLSWGGKHDGEELINTAIRYRLNVAAAVSGVKRKQALPETITVGSETFSVVDGDQTDYRISDPTPEAGSLPYIVGLRLKRTPGQTAEQAKRFCIA